MLVKSQFILIAILFSLILASCTTLPNVSYYSESHYNSKKDSKFGSNFSSKFTSHASDDPFKRMTEDELRSRVENLTIQEKEAHFIKYIMDLNPVNAKIILDTVNKGQKGINFISVSKVYSELYYKDINIEVSLLDELSYKLLSASNKDELYKIVETMLFYINSYNLNIKSSDNSQMTYTEYFYTKNWVVSLLITIARTLNDLSPDSDGSDPLYGVEFPKLFYSILQFRTMEEKADHFLLPSNDELLNQYDIIYSLNTLYKNKKDGIIKIGKVEFDADQLYKSSIKVLKSLRDTTISDINYTNYDSYITDSNKKIIEDIDKISKKVSMTKAKEEQDKKRRKAEVKQGFKEFMNIFMAVLINELPKMAADLNEFNNEVSMSTNNALNGYYDPPPLYGSSYNDNTPLDPYSNSYQSNSYSSGLTLTVLDEEEYTGPEFDDDSYNDLMESKKRKMELIAEFNERTKTTDWGEPNYTPIGKNTSRLIDVGFGITISVSDSKVVDTREHKSANVAAE